MFVKYTLQDRRIIGQVESKSFIRNFTFNALKIKLFRPTCVVINCFLMFFIEFRRKCLKWAMIAHSRYSLLTPWHIVFLVQFIHKVISVIFCLLLHNRKRWIKPLAPFLSYYNTLPVLPQFFQLHLRNCGTLSVLQPKCLYIVYTLIQLCVTCPARLIILVIILLCELWIVRIIRCQDGIILSFIVLTNFLNPHIRLSTLI